MLVPTRKTSASITFMWGLSAHASIQLGFFHETTRQIMLQIVAVSGRNAIRKRLKCINRVHDAKHHISFFGNVCTTSQGCLGLRRENPHKKGEGK